MPPDPVPDIAVHRARRHRLLQDLGEGVFILATAPEVIRNRDAHYPYRFDSHFYYLTAFPEPEAVLVLIAGRRPRQILFCRDRSPEREIWDGRRHGPRAAKEAFGFDAAHSIRELDRRMPRLLENQPRLAYAFGNDAAWDARVLGWINQTRAQARTGITAPPILTHAHTLVDSMRLLKDEHELTLMQRVADVSAQAHMAAMRACRPGMGEWEIEAELLRGFRRQGCQAPAYTPIVAGGANACVLHYVNNDAVLRDGDLLLIDAGGEYYGYAADITRCFPVNGRFSGPQKTVYEIVLAAQLAAIDSVRPGNGFDVPHAAALRVLTQGMVDLKLLRGEVDGLLEAEAYKRFYMHRTSHWLGLDVHDAGSYKQDGTWRELVPGMALTVEPGMYIRPAEDVPPALHNIGIRIEDDVVVTPQDHRVLTDAAPKTIGAIEEFMRAR
ncbi:MAG TPA: aminopeptidase P N-terminal domain-containing protein [Thiobacillaceae bacterium]|nr:aminopeptidase P N-terminal domain-containing protein [Thiobacillaceae bacterium]HNU64683.1 aminopeptidase P N-terminal domain-containing protein [Thiobacillaceae bacterium]